MKKRAGSIQYSQQISSQAFTQKICVDPNMLLLFYPYSEFHKSFIIFSRVAILSEFKCVYHVQIRQKLREYMPIRLAPKMAADADADVCHPFFHIYGTSPASPRVEPTEFTSSAWVKAALK